MNIRLPHSILVVGIGNEDRGDDGAGLVAARYARIRLPSAVRVIEHSGEGTGLIELWQTAGRQQVYLIDAMSSGAVPGSIRRFEVHKEALPIYLTGSSSHLFGVAQAIELARVLGCLPLQVTVYAIEGRSFALGAPLSCEIQDAVCSVIESIVVSVRGNRFNAQSRAGELGF